MVRPKRRVTIGIPVLNGADQIGQAIADFQEQTFEDWEIVVCDNASDDGTADIVEALAEDDDRIHVIRYEERVHVLHSFRRVLNHADSPFFAFAPVDDRHYPRFLEACLAAFEGDPKCVAVCPKVAMVTDGQFQEFSSGTDPLNGDPMENVSRFLTDPGNANRLFGVIRSSALKDCWPETLQAAVDFHAIARFLRHGVTKEIDAVLIERSRTPPERYRRQDEALAHSFLSRQFPHLPVARAIWRDKDLPNSWSLFKALATLVARSHMFRARMAHPRWAAFVDSVYPRIEPY